MVTETVFTACHLTFSVDILLAEAWRLVILAELVSNASFPKSFCTRRIMYRKLPATISLFRTDLLSLAFNAVVHRRVTHARKA